MAIIIWFDTKFNGKVNGVGFMWIGVPAIRLCAYMTTFWPV